MTEEPYQTADDTLDFWQVSKIIDCFELVEEVSGNIHTPLEVYSRYFADDFDSTREEILEKYFSDYVYEDQENESITQIKKANLSVGADGFAFLK